MRTTDIWFASFLQLKGYQLSNFSILNRGKGSFDFVISEEEWKTMHLAFNSSDISKIKQIQLSLKDLLY
jgi:hypothetical protein